MRFERAVAVYILSSKNEVLMLNHKKLDVWLPPGGHIEDNELIHEAAIREVLEETGVEMDFIYNTSIFPEKKDLRVELLPSPLFVQLENLGDHCHEDFVYLSRAIKDDIENREGHDMGWFEIDRALKLNIFNNVKEQLKFIKMMIEKNEL